MIVFSHMDLDLKALREKAMAMAPIKEQERRQQQELNREAEKHGEQERLAEKRNATIAKAQGLLRSALEDAAAEGKRESIVYCKSGNGCSKSYSGTFSHTHGLSCMREEFQEVHTLAQREGLEVRFLTKVHHTFGLSRCGGTHSDSCVSFYLSIRF